MCSGGVSMRPMVRVSRVGGGFLESSHPPLQRLKKKYCVLAEPFPTSGAQLVSKETFFFNEQGIVRNPHEAHTSAFSDV